jgi:hypothetical protein
LRTGFEGLFEMKRNEMLGDWRKRYNEEIHNFSSLPNIITKNKSKG